MLGDRTEHAKAQGDDEKHGLDNAHAFVTAGAHVGREVPNSL